MQINQTSRFELVINQRVTIRLGSAINKRFVEFLSFGFAAFTSLRLHLYAQSGPRGRERRKTAQCRTTQGGEGGYVSGFHSKIPSIPQSYSVTGYVSFEMPFE